MLSKSAKIFVAGHSGLVGSAIVRELRTQNYNNIITVSHCDLDLTIQADVEKYFGDNKPEYVFLAAAKVGGIKANSDSPADFFYAFLGTRYKTAICILRPHQIITLLVD